jgi:hypothetical protein
MRAVQWTRSKDASGGVLRKVLTQRELAEQQYGSWQQDTRSHQGLDKRIVQHMLLAETPMPAASKTGWNPTPRCPSAYAAFTAATCGRCPCRLTVPQGR